MAKGDDTTKTPESPSASQLPQQNQYLTGNPSTQPDANTRWMGGDANSPTGTDSAGNRTIDQSPSQQPINNGTMLGQITAGSVGQYMPGGYDQGKFNDPNKHDPKYDVGRILSKYPPGPEGLQAARNELQQAGYQIVGKDKVQGPAGLIDVGFSFSDPNAQHSWQWNPVVDTYNNPGMGQNNSMLGQGGNQNNFLQQMFQQLMARRQQYAGQQFNPTGGSMPDFASKVPGGGITGGMDFSGGIQPNPQFQMYPQPADPGSYFNQKPGFSYIAPYGMPQ